MRSLTLSLVWLFLCRSLDAMSLNGERTDKQDIRAEVREEALPKRVKRGWMWNQFSVMEEYTGTDNHVNYIHIYFIYFIYTFKLK
uniref:Uncharacterized protein n=1 Tax=Oryzias melastigma TaxID=30732 RepID=A0A3B3DWZ9_ORYME